MSKVVAAALVVSSLACASPIGPRPVTAESVRQARAAALVTADTADVIVMQFQEPTAVRVGQTVGLKPLHDGARWQVSFSNTALALLTPLERLADPGDAGWVWKALMSGTTEIMLTSVAPCGAPPCQPNVQRVTITLEVSGS